MIGLENPASGSTGQRPDAAEGDRSASLVRPPTPRSLLRYAPAFVLLAAVVADSVQQADTDLWIHIRFGQFLLHTGHLLRRDIYSYSAPGSPWSNHEWLTDVVMALFYQAGGVVGLKVMKFLCAAAIMALLAMGTAETGAEYPVQLASLLLAALGLRLQIQFRPQLFDYILLSALLAMFARESQGRRSHLWLVVPMMALWANLHGGFLIGLAVLGFYTAVVAVEDRLAGRGWRRTIELAGLTAAASIATLINPFGIGEWYVTLGKFSEPIVGSHRNIEFQSLFHQLAAPGSGIAMFYICVFPAVMTAATLITFVLTPRRDDLALTAIAMVMICGWLYSMRNMAFAVIACTAPLTRHLSLVTASPTGGAEQRPHDETGRAQPALQIVTLVLAVFVAAFGNIFSTSLPIARNYPVGAVAFMERNQLSGNILSTYEWGGYIVWHEVPPSKVFIDSFESRFPPAVQYDYLHFMAGGSATVQVLERYPHDYVLIPVSSGPYLPISKLNGWALIYRDSVCALFARTGSAAARNTVEATAPPSVFP